MTPVTRYTAAEMADAGCDTKCAECGITIMWFEGEWSTPTGSKGCTSTEPHRPTTVDEERCAMLRQAAEGQGEPDVATKLKVERARDAVCLLRDSARTGGPLGFRERDPLVVAIHDALDLVVARSHWCPGNTPSLAATPTEPTPPPAVETSKQCRWTPDDDDGGYRTSCGHHWYFDEGGTPAEHKIRFCGYCAGVIDAAKGEAAK